MKYIKALVVIGGEIRGDKHLLLEVPSEWKIKVQTEKFLMCKNPADKDLAYNVSMIESITELDEKVYQDAVIRAQKAAEEEFAKTMGINSEVKK